MSGATIALVLAVLVGGAAGEFWQRKRGLWAGICFIFSLNFLALNILLRVGVLA